jgi:hypothetical protein
MRLIARINYLFLLPWSWKTNSEAGPVRYALPYCSGRNRDLRESEPEVAHENSYSTHLHDPSRIVGGLASGW